MYCSWILRILQFYRQFQMSWPFWITLTIIAKRDCVMFFWMKYSVSMTGPGHVEPFGAETAQSLSVVRIRVSYPANSPKSFPEGTSHSRYIHLCTKNCWPTGKNSEKKSQSRIISFGADSQNELNSTAKMVSAFILTN